MTKISINQTSSATRDGHLKIKNGLPISSSLQIVADEFNTDTAIQLSTLVLKAQSSEQCPLEVESTGAGGGISLMDNTTTDADSVGIGAFGDDLCFRSGGSAAGNMRLTAAGNLGIGTSTPSTRLHVNDSGATNTALIEGSGGRTLYSYHDGSGVGWATGAGGSGGYGNLVYLNEASNLVDIYTGGVLRNRINSNGITFNGDTAAANALNDYEEGTFTPVVEGSTTAGTASYTVQNGKYTKIGNVVNFQIMLFFTGHTGTGNITITGLPFATANITNVVPSGSVYYTLLTTAQPNVQYVISANDTVLQLCTCSTGASFAAVPMDASFEARIVGSYQVS